MSEKPTDPAELDDIGDRYRGDSANDAGRPAATVRAAVLAHAAQLAAKNRAEQAGAVPPRRTAPRRLRPVLYGSLAAAAFAGVLMTPYWFSIAPPTPAPETSVVRSERSTGVLREPALAPAEPPLAPAEPQSAMPPRSADSPAAPSARRNSGATAGSTIAATTPPVASFEAPSSAQSLGPSAGHPAALAAESRFATARAAKPGAASADADAGAGAVAGAVIGGNDLPSAARTGNLPMLQTLLEKHPDLEARDTDGRTALMLAATHGQLAAVEALLAHGADPNAADIHGVTPLQAALAAHQPAIADALERAGAQ